MSFFKTQATPSWPCPAHPHLPRPAVFGDTGLPYSAAPYVLGENISFPPLASEEQPEHVKAKKDEEKGTAEA